MTVSFLPDSDKDSYKVGTNVLLYVKVFFWYSLLLITKAEMKAELCVTLKK